MSGLSATTGIGSTSGTGLTLNNALLSGGTGIPGGTTGSGLNPNVFVNVGNSMNNGFGSSTSPGLASGFNNTGFLGNATAGSTTSPFVIPTTGQFNGFTTNPNVSPTSGAFNVFTTSPFVTPTGTNSGTGSGVMIF